jgi:4-diphosphocytidyl-2-C-methyl-D-erythritol kinase
VSVTVRAPAKVNLHLGVGSLRPDGYHDLVTVFQAVSLYDEITVSEASELRVVVSGPSARLVPLDASNLAARAASVVAQRLGRKPAVRITIRKGIPVAAGMAGGSTDAAAALVACDALWSGGLRADELHELAAGLGSDVPFCLAGGTALASGRGEELTTVLGRGSYEWVFAVADSGLSTPAVYAELDRIRGQRLAVAAPAPTDLLAALLSGDPRIVAPLLHNDLQEAALGLKPALRRTLEAGMDAGALGGVVCGSGPTCAFLAAAEPAAVAMVAALAGSGTCAAVLRGHGPVHGARVVG